MANTQFPGLDQKYVAEIEARTKDIPEQFKSQAQQLMYSDYYQKQKMEKDQAQRLEYKNQLMQKTIGSRDSNDKAVQNANLKLANLADMIRNKHHIDLSAGDDTQVVNTFVDQLPNGNKQLLDYINGKNSDLLTKSGLIDNSTFNKLTNLNRQNNVGMTQNVDNSVTDAQKKVEQTSLRSSSHFDDDNYASNFLAQQGQEWSKFIEGARSQGYIDGEIASVINAKQTYDRLQAEEAQRQQEFKDRGFGDKAEEVNVGVFQGFTNFFANAYNNLLADNPYIGLTHTHRLNNVNFSDDLLGAGNNIGDLRSTSGYSKGGNIAGDLIANTAVMMLMPEIGGGAGFKPQSIIDAAAENGWRGVAGEITDRAIIGAAEGGEFGLLASVGQENPQENLGTNVVAGMTLGGLFGVGQGGVQTYKAWRGLSKELAEAGKKETIGNLTDIYNRAIRPTSRGVKSNTQIEKYNNDMIDSVELITKNKDNLRFVDANGEEIVGQLPKTVDEFGQAIKQTENDLYSSWSQMVKEAGKSADVDTTNVVNELKKLKNNKEWLAGQNQSTINEIDKWINDLERLNNKMSIEGVQQKTQELNQELTAFFKSNNPNDVGPNSIKALVNNEFKKGIDNAIENAGLDSEAYQDLKRAYSALKSIESDVNHRAVVYGRQNPQSLVDSMSDLSSIDAIASFLKDPVKGTTKFLGSQIEKTITRNRNNPNKMIENLFKKADDTISKSSNSSLKTVAQQEAEQSARNTARQNTQIRNERQARQEQRQWLRQRLDAVKQENEARYQEYLRGKGVGSETQALPQREGVNNYNTIIADNGTPTVVTPEGTAVRQGQIAEKPSQNVNYNERIPRDEIKMTAKEIDNITAPNGLESRVSGDDLLNAQDLIEEIKSVGAKVDENGYVTVYHQTTPENAQKIMESGKMSGKENGIFFSTSKDASQAAGRGTTKLEYKIPAEKLELDDVFANNADLKIKAKPGEEIDISEYLVKGNNKSEQLKIIQETNPAKDDIHTWIRSESDIKTYKEAIDEYGAIEDLTPDYTADMVKKALDEGEVTVYSSYPIENGNWVTPSKMEAQSYAGGGKVYSKKVKLDDVAWMDELQGQYASTRGLK